MVVGTQLDKLFEWEESERVRNWVVEDRVDQSAGWLITALARSATLRGLGTVFLTFDKVKDQLTSLPPWNSSQVTVLDGLDQFDPTNPHSQLDLLDLYQNIIIEHDKLLQSGCKKVVVTIDTVNSLYDLSETIKVFPFLNKLSELVKGNLVLLYHGDVPTSTESPSSLKSHLDYLGGTYLTLTNHTRRYEMDRTYVDEEGFLEFYPEVNQPDTYLIDLVHQLTAGAVAREFAVVKLKLPTEDGENSVGFEFAPYLDPSADEVPSENQSSNQSTDPKSGSQPTSAVDSLATSLSDVSFNLHLTDRQRAAKDDLVLPYLANATTNIQPPGTIHYHPDDGDDFDEDDPDDDLEI